MRRLQNRSLICPDYDAEKGVIALSVRLETAYFANHYFIVTDDKLSKVIGVLENDRVYLIGDSVMITGDCRGYIAPGIKQPGNGVIVEIKKDDTDHYYRILMDNGEMGSVKSARIDHIVNDG